MNPTEEIRSADYQQLSSDYKLVENALIYLDNHYLEQPTLEQVAASVGLSEYHFQRLFAHWVGISPKRFLQFLTKEHAKAMLDQSANLLEAAYQSGLSGPGRLHDLFVSCEAVTPGEYKSRGDGLTIVFGFHPSPFGECLLASTERGICGLSFVSGSDRQSALTGLRARWRKAKLVEDPAQTAPLLHQAFPVQRDMPTAPLRLLLNGTNFQIKVWEALLRIPPGKVVAYEDIAIHLGMPKAARAVSRAVADNPIAVIIPCHRVIRKMGLLGGYRYGLARKQALLGWEMARGQA